MKNQIVIPTGYMGSGSSAITDLISEIEGYRDNNGDYEYILMHCPDGVFDLEDKLLNGNNAIRSDEAIYRFLQCMKDLYDKKNYWVSGYRNTISEKFIDYCNKFVSQLNPVKMNKVYWYFQQKPINNRMQMIYLLRRIVGKISFHKIILNRPVLYKNMNIAFPSSDDFFNAAKCFLNDIFRDLGYDNNSLILDQFLLPHNLFRIGNYFDESLRVFVVDRDPRDVFILNKYFWRKRSVAIPYPIEVNEFCKMYRNMRKSEKWIEDKRILRIHFEDLVFKYEQILPIIYQFLDVEEIKHIDHKRTNFNPSISINNTMIFKREEFYIEEVDVITKNLRDYLYDFPNKDIRINKRKTIF